MKAYKYLVVSEWALQFRYTSAGGPGGQNVNRRSTAVELRFDTKCLKNQEDPAVLQRLHRIAGRRINSDGILILQANRRRNQVQNQEAVVEVLADFLKKARQEPIKRIPTKPTVASKFRDKTAQQQHSQKKMERRFDSSDY